MFLFFHSSIIVKDIYTCKSRNNVQPNKHAFNHKLFHIYNYVEITRELQTCLFRLIGSPTDPFTAIQLFNRITYTEAWASTSLSLFSHPGVLSWVLLSNLIYNPLLLFIGNLKIASMWINWLTIKDCNNYLPNNLASQINSTGLHCLLVDSSFLSDWQIISWLVQILTESAKSQVQICE